MNEIYVDTAEEIELKISHKGQRVNADTITLTVTNVDSGTEVFSGQPNTELEDDNTTEFYTYTFGPDLTSDPTKYKVDWDYTYTVDTVSYTGDKVQYVEVVVPYVTLDEIRNQFSDLADKTDKELRFMERTVRGVINNYCSQDFSYELNKTKSAYGRNSNTLQLPDRLYEFTGASLEGTDLTNYIETTGDRYLLRRQQNYDDAIKRDVQNVLSTRRYFKENREYQITGNWGWEYVPSQVKQAALILINDYFCNDSKWRERYVDNIRAADWRMEFAKTGDQTTGNANADMLLQPYRNIDAVII